MTCTFAQSLDQIMENYFSKIGGKEKVASINSSKETSFNWFRKNKEEDPEKARPIKTTTILREPYYKKFVSYDSKGNWDNEFFYNEKGSVLAMGSVIQKRMGSTQVTVCTASDLLKWYEEQSLKYYGEKNLGGENYYVISKNENKDFQFYYFNKQTHLLDASQLQDWPDRITYYKEYKMTNFVLHPFLQESYQNGSIYYKQITESYEFNPVVDSKLFYFDEKEYEKRNEPGIKYQSVKLEAKESELDEFIKSNFKGRRVFIDIWATWCAPCKKEFKNYDSVYYAFMEKNNIDLVYLSIDRDVDKKAWEADINRTGLKGYHARANKKMMQSVTNLVYNGGTVIIPRYILISEQGKMLSKDFKRPSDPAFAEEIESFLSSK